MLGCIFVHVTILALDSASITEGTIHYHRRGQASRTFPPIYFERIIGHYLGMGLAVFLSVPNLVYQLEGSWRRIEVHL